MKVILPNALKCGCGYELFWHLNPAKLESFYEAYRMEIKERMTMQDSFAWLQGVYIREAILSVINRATPYPREPRGLGQEEDLHYDDRDRDTESRSPHRMTDGQSFALFMVKHNKALQEKRAKKKHNA